MGASSPAPAEQAAGPDPASLASSERRAADAYEAYAKKDYALAVSLYLEAYDAAPISSILYNIARIYDTKLGNYPLAIKFYRRYLADPGATGDLVPLANQRLRGLRGERIAASETMAPSSASEGYATLGEPASAQVTRGASQERKSSWSPLRWTGVAAGAAGLVGLGVGGAFGLLAMSKANTAHDACDGNACTSQAGVDAAHAAGRDATFANIGIGVGGALLVTGAALFFVGGEKTRQPTSQAGLRLDTRTTASGVSLHVSGRW